MLDTYVENFIGYLISRKYLCETRKEQYIYHVTCMVEAAIATIIVLGIGIIYDCLLNTMVFMFFFSQLRKYCGGYHAQTYGGCLFFSVLIYLAFVWKIEEMVIVYYSWTQGLFFVAVIVIEILGAVEPEGIGWRRKEYLESKKISRLWAIIEYFVLVTMQFLKVRTDIIVYMGFAIILNAILLLIEKIRGGESDEKERKSIGNGI